jgi:hypothetical protein
MNLSHYRLFVGVEPHPIDIAWMQFFVIALCPGSTAANTRSATTLLMPGISTLDQFRG